MYITPEIGDFNDIIPAGEYLVEVTDCKEIEKNWGKGFYVTYTICYPLSLKNKRQNDFFCFEYPSKPETQQYALRDLSYLCLACNLKNGFDTSSKELIGKQIKIETYHQVNKKDGKTESKVKRRQGLTHADYLLLNHAKSFVPPPTFSKIDDSDVPF